MKLSPTIELSLAVPITNSLTFVFTAIAGTLLGEKIESKGINLPSFLISSTNPLSGHPHYSLTHPFKPSFPETYIGMALVTLGVGLCVMGKT